MQMAAIPVIRRSPPPPIILGLWLGVQLPPEGIHMHKDAQQIGVWARERLAERLAEKHSRAAFVTAESRRLGAATQYKFAYNTDPG